jgi:hypothetical protein
MRIVPPSQSEEKPAGNAAHFGRALANSNPGYFFPDAHREE